MRAASTTTPPKEEVARRGPYVLSPFDRLMAPVVARWARDEQELFWLAPKTPPPLTAAKVVAWASPDGRPLLFYHDDAAEPVGYLELNPMPADWGHFWLGHCVTRPDLRGQGVGRHMIGLTIEFAFRHRRAYRVSLVVFPENTSAIRCYRNAGFVDAGEQWKFFATTGQQHRMIQMTIDRGRYLSLPAARTDR